LINQESGKGYKVRLSKAVPANEKVCPETGKLERRALGPFVERACGAMEAALKDDWLEAPLRRN
jgi:hypothetical protein